MREAGLVYRAPSPPLLSPQLGVGVRARPELRTATRERLRDAGASVVLARPGDALCGFGLAAAGLADWAAWAVRQEVGPFCVLLGEVGSQSLAPVTAGLRRATRAPERLCVIGRAGDPRRAPLAAALTAYAALLRTRSPATWRALDALDLVNNNAVAAARFSAALLRPFAPTGRAATWPLPASFRCSLRRSSPAEAQQTLPPPVRAAPSGPRPLKRSSPLAAPSSFGTQPLTARVRSQPPRVSSHAPDPAQRNLMRLPGSNPSSTQDAQGSRTRGARPSSLW